MSQLGIYRFACPTCWKKYRVKTKRAGEITFCVKCGQRLQTPISEPKTEFSEIIPEKEQLLKSANSFPPPVPKVPAEPEKLSDGISYSPVRAPINEDWFVTLDHDTYFGPCSWEELQELATSGSLRVTDLIWKSGMNEWVAAKSAVGLFKEDALPRASHAPIFFLRDFWHQMKRWIANHPQDWVYPLYLSIGLYLCWFAAFMLGVYLIGLSAILVIGMILLFLVTPPFAIWAFRN